MPRDLGWTEVAVTVPNAVGTRLMDSRVATKVAKSHHSACTICLTPTPHRMKYQLLACGSSACKRVMPDAPCRWRGKLLTCCETQVMSLFEGNAHFSLELEPRRKSMTIAQKAFCKELALQRVKPLRIRNAMRGKFQLSPEALPSLQTIQNFVGYYTRARARRGNQSPDRAHAHANGNRNGNDNGNADDTNGNDTMRNSTSVNANGYVSTSAGVEPTPVPSQPSALMQMPAQLVMAMPPPQPTQTPVYSSPVDPHNAERAVMLSIIDSQRRELERRERAREENAKFTDKLSSKIQSLQERLAAVEQKSMAELREVMQRMDQQAAATEYILQSLGLSPPPTGTPSSNPMATSTPPSSFLAPLTGPISGSSHGFDRPHLHLGG